MRETRERIIAVRVNPKEAEILTQKAAAFTNGSLSDFLRGAIYKWEPKKRTKLTLGANKKEKSDI